MRTLVVFKDTVTEDIMSQKKIWTNGYWTKVLGDCARTYGDEVQELNSMEHAVELAEMIGFDGAFVEARTDSQWWQLINDLAELVPWVVVVSTNLEDKSHCFGDIKFRHAPFVCPNLLHPEGLKPDQAYLGGAA